MKSVDTHMVHWCMIDDSVTISCSQNEFYVASHWLDDRAILRDGFVANLVCIDGPKEIKTCSLQ